MNYMRSNLAFALFWINLITSGLIIFFYIKMYKDYYSENYRLNHYILYIDIVAIFFEILFMISFCITKNECCSSESDEEFAIGTCYGTCVCCDDCGRNEADCKCECNNDKDEAKGLCILFVLCIIFVLIFFSIRACGKHISRIFSAIFLSLIDIALIALAVLTGNDLYRTLIIVFSLLAAISNILGIILPNLLCCQLLSYDHIALLRNQQPDQLPLVKPVSADFPPQNVVQPTSNQPIVPVYNEPNQGYSGGSGIYDAPNYQNAPPQNSPMYPPPANNYPGAQ